MAAGISEEAESVKCVVCKHGDARSGTTTVTLTRNGTTLVVQGVPARVCSNCDEEYVDELTTARLLEVAERGGPGLRWTRILAVVRKPRTLRAAKARPVRGGAGDEGSRDRCT